MLPVTTIVPDPALNVGVLDSDPSSFRVMFLTVIPLSPMSIVGVPVFVPSDVTLNSSMLMFGPIAETVAPPLPEPAFTSSNLTSVKLPPAASSSTSLELSAITCIVSVTTKLVISLNVVLE